MASEESLDTVARRLAGRPIPRRSALKLTFVAFAGLSLPPLRPQLAFAQVQQCTQETEYCRAVECPIGSICCYGPPNPSSPSGCVTNPHCCDPCDPTASRCLGDGSCGPGPKAASCGCGASGIRCEAGQYCDEARGICCPPDPRDECRSPEPVCRDRVDDDVKEYQREVCLGRSEASSVGTKFTESTFDAFGMMGDGEKASATLGCMTFSEAVLRRSRLEECGQVPDDSRCGGAGCDGGSGLCRRPRCGEPRSARSAVEAFSVWRSELAEPPTAFAAAAGNRELRRAVDRGVRRMRTNARRAGRLFAVEPQGYRRADLADALRDLRADVLATHRSVVRLKVRGPRARRGRREVLATLKAGAQALDLAARACEAPDVATARSLGTRARTAFKRAGRSSKRARRIIR